MRLAAVGAVAVVLGTACAGCGGGGEEPARAAQPLPPSVYGRAEPEAGRALLRFVRAGRRGDQAAMWSLLSKDTRAGFGGTLARFRRDAGADYADQFELLSGARVLLARRLGRFAVAAIAGMRPPDEGEKPEEYAFALALVREDGGWRVETGGLVLEGMKPGTLDETDRRPQLGARADAAGPVGRLVLWLDGRPFPIARTSELPFTAEIDGRPPRELMPGVHRAVVFANGGGTAAAVAWPFLVDS